MAESTSGKSSRTAQSSPGQTPVNSPPPNLARTGSVITVAALILAIGTGALLSALAVANPWMLALKSMLPALIVTLVSTALLIRATSRSVHALLGALVAGMILRLVMLVAALVVARFQPGLTGIATEQLLAFGICLMGMTALLLALEVVLCIRMQRNPEVDPATAAMD